MNSLWCTAVLMGVLLASCNGLKLPGVPASFTSEQQLTAAISASVADEISHEYAKYHKTGIVSLRLLELGGLIRDSHSQKDILTKPLVELSAADQFVVCTMCRATVNVVVRTFTSPDGELNGPNREADTKRLVVGICQYFGIAPLAVCEGIFDLNWPIFDFIFNETIADSRTVCGMLPIPICSVEQTEFNFNLNIDGQLPTESKSELPERSSDDFTVLQLTDIHYDPEYVAGGLAACKEPMCCRQEMPNQDTSAPSGYWSDYRDCDTPLRLIENAFEHIAGVHKLDWIYHTGDVPPHNVWSTTKQGNIDMLSKIDKMLTEYFPKIPVYSCLGNHEPHPTNVFGSNEVPAELSASWLYDHVWSLWSKWLPSDAEATVRRGGYYTALRSTGHRIIALNSMDCYLFNWWVFYNGTIVIEQLQWFHDTLLAAEAAGEQVNILSHIPSGDADCSLIWSREYNRILTRFHKIISGIFNGHTHRDEMNVHYTEQQKAVAVSWNGGSLTSYSNTNPNYRIYTLSSTNMQVMDHQTWIFNLTAANSQPDKGPTWFEEYQFSKEFTDDTSPAGIDRLLDKMATDPELLLKFWRFKVTQGDPFLEKGCNDRCLQATICRLATSNYGDKRRCRELQDILKEHLKEPVEPPKDDGAASLMAYSLSSLLALLYALRFLS